MNCSAIVAAPMGASQVAITPPNAEPPKDSDTFALFEKEGFSVISFAAMSQSLQSLDYRGASMTDAKVFRVKKAFWKISGDSILDLVVLPCTNITALNDQDIVIYHNKQDGRIYVRRLFDVGGHIELVHLARLEAMQIFNETQMELYYRVLFWVSYPTPPKA